MIKTIVICDVCEKPIPADEHGNIYLHKTKEWDTHILFPHMCKDCADKIDKALATVKAGAGAKAQLAAKFAKVNAERKEQLGTKG